MKTWKKYLSCCIMVMVLICRLCAQEFSASDDSDLSGIYLGRINNMEVTLEIDVNEGQLEGDIEVGETEYTFEGTVDGKKASGIWYNEQGEKSAEFTATLKEDELSIILHNSGPNRTLTESELYFRRQTATEDEEPITDSQFNGDSRLIGVWAKQEIMSGGGASVASQVFLYLNQDGTFRYGDARTVGGGAGWSGSVGGSETTAGKWRTENGVFQVMLEGNSQWLPFARYHLEQGKLLFMGFDGSRELWYRQN